MRTGVARLMPKDRNVAGETQEDLSRVMAALMAVLWLARTEQRCANADRRKIQKRRGAPVARSASDVSRPAPGAGLSAPCARDQYGQITRPQRRLK